MEFDSAFVQEWLRIADMDMLTAEHMCEVHPAPLEIICFHSHQVAEKLLKAYLFSRQVAPPKMHDLIRLCELCMAQDPLFCALAPTCGFLTLYGIQPRYPHDLQIDDNIARLCLQYANQIKDFAPLAELRTAPEQTE
ncbi:MAG: HEPN domain-containing protein [Oscillospiraceae bacterium]|jgi:HEPN domain-containing protein|nr:HEPN domain-containing protein [Oscillospiraceae bacterium]